MWEGTNLCNPGAEGFRFGGTAKPRNLDIVRLAPGVFRRPRDGNVVTVPFWVQPTDHTTLIPIVIQKKKIGIVIRGRSLTLATKGSIEHLIAKHILFAL